MIVVIAVREDYIKSPDFGKLVVSHGVDLDTGRNVIMEQVVASKAWYITFDKKYGYVILDDAFS